MGNRIGIIFHENYEYFSPLIYDHFGGENMKNWVYAYLEDYNKKYCKEDHDGHLYNCDHIVVGYLVFIKADRDVRVENLSNEQLEELKLNHKYFNEFDAGCLLINVEKNNFGNIDIC
jgi:hypothetical protein